MRYLHDENDEPYTSETFNLDHYLSTFDPELLEYPEGRRALTRLDPLLHALIFFPHHLKDSAGRISFSDAHLDWMRHALAWVRKSRVPSANRKAFIAPRETGKTTAWFGLLPHWGAAHGHIKFIAAFSASAGQAESHLMTFKQELETNELLRLDFPDFCEPLTRNRGVTVSDNVGRWQSESGFAFVARGIDSSNLGMKIGAQRPDLILLDDVEDEEARYSPYLAEKRLGTIRDAILPLNIYAHVVFVGTVTMPGSVMHQLVQVARGEHQSLGEGEAAKKLDWVAEENVRPYHYPAIITRPDGSVRSLWENKWPVRWLLERQHTRSYRKNYANDPMASDGAYWSSDDFMYATDDDLRLVTKTLLSLDPGVTTKRTSDFTGCAILGYIPAQAGNGTDQPAIPSRVVVLKAYEVKLVGEGLRQHVLKTLEEWPDIRWVLVESNQAGEHWNGILHHVPAKVITHWASEKKEVRAADLLKYYQSIPARVLHAGTQGALEAQMVKFPLDAHDDMVDAVGTGVRRLLVPPKPKRAGLVSTQSYI